MPTARLALIPSLALCLAVAVATPAHAATSVDSVTMSTNSVAASGAAVATFTVSAHLTSDQPITSSQDACFPTYYPLVVFRATGTTIANGIQAAHLSLGSGTTTDGTWTATVHVTSGWAGNWRLAGIYVGGAGMCSDNVPFDWQPASTTDPAYALHVNGSNTPRITYAFSPSPAAWTATSVGITGHALLQNGAPIAHVTVVLAVENGCGDYSSPRGQSVTTSANGTFTATVPVGMFLGCLSIDATPSGATHDEVNYLTRNFYPERRVHLTASVYPTRVRLGRYVDISGVIGQAVVDAHCVLHLQRYAAGTWHNVPATLRVGQQTAQTINGQQVYTEPYRFHTAPPAPGNVRYRVYFPSQKCDAGAGGTYAGSLTPVMVVGVI